MKSHAILKRYYMAAIPLFFFTKLFHFCSLLLICPSDNFCFFYLKAELISTIYLSIYQCHVKPDVSLMKENTLPPTSTTSVVLCVWLLLCLSIQWFISDFNFVCTMYIYLKIKKWIVFVNGNWEFGNEEPPF